MVKTKQNKGPEQKKYEKWFRAEKKKGLLGVNFFWNYDSDYSKETMESLYGEINRMIAAPSLPDPEVLGKYSPL